MPANSRIRIIGKQVYAEESFHLEALLSLGEPLADFGEGRIRIRHPERSDRKPARVLLTTGERVRMNRTGWQKLIALHSL
jgi:hypothetical protein